jgi:hypothetical protein
MRASVTVCMVSFTTDADSHHDEVGLDLGSVLELDRLDAAVRAANELLRLRADQELQAALLQRLLQQLARHVVELALHQPRHHVHHSDVHAALHQAIGRFQAQQAAADDDRFPELLRGLDHRVGVGDVAVGDHALQVLAGHGQDEGVGAGAQQQAVICLLGAIVRAHDALDPVDLHHPLARVQPDAVLLVPLPGVQHDLVQRLLARQHRRQQDAVVVRVRLRTEHADLVQLRLDLQQLLEGAHAGHAVADHHQFHLLHGWTPRVSGRGGLWGPPLVAFRTAHGVVRTAGGKVHGPGASSHPMWLALQGPCQPARAALALCCRALRALS